MASEEVADGEEGFLFKLNTARREMKDKFRAAHELLEKREAEMLKEFQELEVGFRGVEIEEEIKQLSLSKEQLQNVLKGNENQEILAKSIAPLEEKIKELESFLEKAREMKSVEFEWDESVEYKLNSLGTIQVDAEKECNKVAPEYAKKETPTESFGMHSNKLKDPGYFAHPQAIAIGKNGNHIYICDAGNNRVQVFDRSYQFLFMFSDKMAGPYGICLLQDKICVTQYDGNYFNIYSQNHMLVQSVGEKGKKELEFEGPCGIATSTKRNRIYICESKNGRIHCLNIDLSFNSFISDIYGVTDVKLSDQEIVVLCACNPCVRIYNHSHQPCRQMVTKGEGNRVILPVLFCLDQNLNIFITDIGAHCILIFSYAGELIHSFGKKGEQRGNFINPRGITMDCEGRIVVTSENPNHCVQIF